MNALILGVLATLACASASGILGGAILQGPSGIVTGNGAIGLGGLGLGGLGLGGIGIGGVGLGGSAITNGGGIVSATAHGAAVQGPPTAPVVVAGPAGKIAADGLWGPTNIWATGGIHG